MKRNSMKIFFFIMVMVLVLAVMGPSLLYAQTGAGGVLSTYDKTNSGFVMYVYNKLLDRNPAQSEVNVWVDRFEDKSASAFTLVKDAIFGTEMGKTTAALSNNDFVKFLYMSIFQRSPDTAGWDHWTMLMSKGWSKEDILEGFARSNEFVMLAGNFKVIPFFTKETSDEKTSTPAKVASVFSAVLATENSIPPVVTAAKGSAVFTLSADGKSIMFTLTADDILNPQAAHIHMGNATTNGSVIISLFPFGSYVVKLQSSTLHEGILSAGTITAANFTGPLAGKTMADLIAAIKAGNTYVNVHTLVYPAGEMRGQIK